MPGRASDIKMVGMAEFGAPIVTTGWQFIRTVGESACVNSILLQKIRYNDVGDSTCLHKHEVGKPSQNATQPCVRAHGCVNDDLRADVLQKGCTFRVGTCGTYTLTGSAGEVAEALSDRKVDLACIQETQWKGSGCKFYGAKVQRYKLFWMGGEERLDSVKISVAEKWVDSVVRHSKSVLILKMVLDNGLLNVLIVYAPHSRKPEEDRVFGMKCSIWRVVYLRMKWLCQPVI